LEKLKTKAKEQIETTFEYYCEHVRPRIQEKIHKKILSEGNNQEESLLNFVFDESYRILDNLKESHPNDRTKIRINPEEVVRKLWETMEEELEKKFVEKKERNMRKNKPTRFAHYRQLEHFVQASKELRLQGDALALAKVKKILVEIEILTDSTEGLIRAVLEQRAEQQVESPDDDFPAVNLILDFDDGQLEVIVSSLENMRPREGRYPSKITLAAALFPGDLGDKRKSQEIQGGSKTLNLDPEVRFTLKAENKMWEEGAFLVLDLCGKWSRMERTQFVGSVVIRLSHRMKFGKESRFRLHDKWSDEERAERRELRLRMDPIAKEFNARKFNLPPASSLSVNGEALVTDTNSIMLG